MMNELSLLAGRSVLIVEDEAITAIGLRRALTAAGMLVVGMAANGEQAVELTLRLRPDIVLMDVEMPGMRGTDAARQVLCYHHPCLVFLTSYEPAELRDDMWDIEPHGFLVKPVEAPEVPAYLEACFTAYLLGNRKHEVAAM